MSHTYMYTEASPLEPVSTSNEEAVIASLPPMPKPDHMQGLSESACGFIFVVAIIIGAVVAVSAVQWGLPCPIAISFSVAIYVEAAIAFGCLMGVLCADPGVVLRTPQTVFPIPHEVQACLNTGMPLEELEKNLVGPDGRVYCVRCLVWRPSEHRSSDSERWKGHHCRVCNRCVAKFDHHCGVFGRCIAGDAYGRSSAERGNIVYFYALLTMAGVAFVTLFLATLTAGSCVPSRVVISSETGTRH